MTGSMLDRVSISTYTRCNYSFQYLEEDHNEISLIVTINGMCAQRSLRSAWASAQSDQRLAVRLKKARIISYPLSAQRRL